MLDLLARHGRLGLDVEAYGDLETGAHHTTEDVGIVPRPGDRPGARGPRRASAATASRRCRWTRRWPSARSTSPAGHSLCFEADLPDVTIAGFDTELAEEFFRAVANNAKLTLHVRVRYGTNAHHMIEAAFKAFARALREAVSIDPDETGVPSTKGTLTS